MTPSRWIRLQHAFDKVVEHKHASRMRIVQMVSSTDPGIQSQLLRLVKAWKTEDPLLDWANRDSANGDGANPSGGPAETPVFAPGDLLVNRFRIVRLLGRGGMGEVYEARDELLRKDRALKTISTAVRAHPDAERRFLAEVALAQSVTHPNVCRIHDIFYHSVIDPQTGQERQIQFLSMQLLNGETLAEYLLRNGPMSPDQALPLLREMAAALDAAHDVGVIHRDFKSANIFVISSAPAGQPVTLHAVVTDFGLASLDLRSPEGQLSAGGHAPEQSLGGTPGFSAPELIDPSKVTTAVDRFALGVVALQMVTGRLRDVEDSRLPETWQRAIASCLHPDPISRPSSAAAFLRDLEGVSSSVEPPEPAVTRRTWLKVSVAAVGTLAATVAAVRWLGPHISSVSVLPFEDRTGIAGGEQSGFTEELIRTLLTSRRLRVVAPYSAQHFQRPFDFRAIARTLKCQAFLTGSISRSEILVQLLRENGSSIWERRFPRQDWSSFVLDKEIEASVLKQVDVSAAERLEQSSYQPSPAGYQAYLSGRLIRTRRAHADIDEAEKLFREAISHDGDFALAWAALADVLQFRDKFVEARTAASRAIDLDPHAADAYVARALVRHRYDWDWQGAQSDFRKALDLAPYCGRAHHAFGGFLSDLARPQPALQELATAIELDPLSVPSAAVLGICYFYAGMYDASIAQLGRAIEQARSAHCLYAGAFGFLGAAWARKGDRDQAYRSFRQAIALDPRDPEMRVHQIVAFARFGERHKAAAKLDEMIAPTPGEPPKLFYIAMAHASVGSIDRAFEILDSGLALHDGDMTLLKVHPYAENLRDDSRYHELLKKIRL